VKLQGCLLQQTWRTLRAIARVRKLPFDDHLSKQDSASRLAQHLIEPDSLRQVLTGLSLEAQAALRALIEADGQMRQEVFTARFGPIRPYKPWRDDAPQAPWESPASPAEELAYRGLVFTANQGTKKRPVWAVILPDEIKAALSPLLERAMSALPSPSPQQSPSSPAEREGVSPQATEAGEGQAPPADVGAAVLTFLCFLNGEDIRPLHGRWLPPTACRTLALRFIQGATHCPSASHLPDRVRSERQLPYLSFVHYLAERAGLVDLEGQWLKPTLVAQGWLAQPRAERVRLLWEAWRENHETNTELWSRFRLPGEPDLSPLIRFNGLLSLLTQLTPGTYPLHDLLDALARRDPALLQPCAPYRIWAELDEDTQADFRQRARRWVAEMLTGPLAWFGVTSNTQYPIPSSQSSIRFTLLGAALLGRDDGTWPEDPPAAPLHLHPPTFDDEGQPTAVPLTVPPGLPPAARFALSALMEEDEDQMKMSAPGQSVTGQPTGSRTHREQVLITPRSLAHALHRGHTVEGLVAFLEELAAEPLHPAVLKALYIWAEAVEAITIAPALLLRVRDPALLQELSSIRRLRARLGETLSARAVTVEADQLEALVRHLERLGFSPRVERQVHEGQAQEGQAQEGQAQEGQAQEGQVQEGQAQEGQVQEGQVQEGQAQDLPLPTDGERTAMAAALRLLVVLSDELGLDLRAPHLLAQRWLEGLPQPQRDAARHQVQKVLEALRHRDAGPGPSTGVSTGLDEVSGRGAEDYRLPSPTAPLLPELEQAIAQGATIEIDYHTAGRGHLLSRRVDPLRLEWRGGVPYLVAFCHLRQENRVFRVDRVERIEVGD
jgi:hypothetical protein